MASFKQDDKSKLWSVRFRTMEHGKEVNKRLRGLKTKKAAQQAYVNYINTHIDDTTILSEITFKQATFAYLENLKINAKYSSYRAQKQRAESHIIPYFANVFVENITSNNAKEW